MRSTALWAGLWSVLAAISLPVLGDTFFHAGHDISSAKIMVDSGAVFIDTARGNVSRPVEDILGDGGMTTVRLRLWVNPVVGVDGYYEVYNLEYVKALAQQVHAKGFKVYLDFHFSDYWADPGKQATPAAWPQDDLDSLASTLRDYVCATLQSFYQAGVDLAIVSLGNELEHGLLWPLGHVDITDPPETVAASFKNLSILLKAAREGVDDAVLAGVPQPQVMIHINNAWDQHLQETWFGNLVATGIFTIADWDMFGFSMYVYFGGNATLPNLSSSLNSMAKIYSKPILIVETSWPVKCSGKELTVTDIPLSVQGQFQWVGSIVDIVKQLPNGLGQGVFYWEPAWLNNTGQGVGCEDVILFDADYSQPELVGYSRESVNIFKGV